MYKLSWKQRRFKMKKILSVLLIIVLALSLSSCGSAAPEDDNGMTPTDTMDAFLRALKARDFDTLQEYYEGEIGDLDLLEEGDDSALSGMIDGLVDRILDFEYSLDNETIKGNDATVDVYFKTYDLGKIMQDLIQSMMTDAATLALPNLDQDELEAEINAIMSEKFDEAMKTAEKDKAIKITMNLIKKDGRWLVKDVTDREDFMNALSGGLMELANSLSLQN